MKKIILLLSLWQPSSLRAQSSIHPQNLRCEYLADPEGIDEVAPRLSWALAAKNLHQYGQLQKAYKILVSTSIKNVNADKGDCWNTGWVAADAMQQIVYKGKPIVSDKTYYWKVCTKDEAGKTSAWSKTAHWSTGLLEAANWSAKWIGSGDVQNPKQIDCSMAGPWFRKSFYCKKQPVKAMLFLASIGFHELYVNGKKITENVLSPCVSNHLKRARYITYNISTALKPGKNIIGVWLGTSWSIYQSYASDDKPRSPIFIAQADVYDASLATPSLRIQSDDSWKTHPSPNKLLGSWSFGHMGGELWDATQEIAGWDLLSLDDKNWKNATAYHPSLILSAQMVEPNKLYHKINAASIQSRPDGSFRVDMGVNFAGCTAIKLKGMPGQRIELLFSEREKEDMTFDIHSAFIIGRTGTGVFKNRFNYSSGRWITIKGLKKKPALADIHGWVARTAYEDAATFTCSDTLQNWIYDKVKWNFENLSLGGYVVDCPQRERLGYGGDAHATSETGMFNYKLGAFYTKWMEDWRDVQGTKAMDSLNYGGNADDGILPHTAPTLQGGGGPGWGGICVTLPWSMYQQEGDTRILETNFNLIKGWLAFLSSHVKNNLLVRFGGTWDFLGDWLWPNANAEGMNNGKPQNSCFNNCYRVYNLRTAAKIARVIGKDAEAKLWAQQANESATAIQQKYYNPNDHSYSDSSMGNLAAALLADIPPASERAAVMQRLEKEILVVRNGHIHVGITGGAMLFKLLRNEGRDDLLYSMTMQTDYPGWGYMKASGATSIWEMWEKDLPGHSLLHSSYLYPGAWYIDGFSGIRKKPGTIGFRSFIVRPPSFANSTVTWSKATFNSPSGLIKSGWQKKAGNLYLDITVPPNTAATVYFPADDSTQIKVSSAWATKAGYQNGYQLFELPAGVYTFSGKEKLIAFKPMQQ